MVSTYVYTMLHDLGFAPNPFNGFCTLACCRADYRRTAQIGDYLVGVGGKDVGPAAGKAVYWMRVDEDLPFSNYRNDSRFAKKRPVIPGPRIDAVGDACYWKNEVTGEWERSQSMHHIDGTKPTKYCHSNRDTKTDRVLISKTFTYWGSDGPTLEFNVRGQKYRSDEEAQHIWDAVGGKVPQGLLGFPSEWAKTNSKYFKGIC